jgi:hypothetical protein
LGYILQFGTDDVLCFLTDAILVSARLGHESLHKLSGLFAIFKRTANNIKPLPHNKKLRKRPQRM